MQRQPNLDHIFTPLSKAIIIIPIAVIAISLFLKAYEKLMLPYKQVTSSHTVAVSDQPAQNITPEPTETKTKIDLQGPYVCEYKDSTGNASVYIKNKQISATFNKINKKESILLKGDCIYKWEGFQGEKTCGISEFIGMFDALSSFGGTTAESVIGTIAQSGLTSATDEALMKNVARTCAKGTVSDSVFILPNIAFKDVGSLQNMQTTP